MYTHNFSRFSQTFYNLSRFRSQVLGEVFLPDKEINAFEQVVRLLRVQTQSEVRSGDQLFNGTGHYAVTIHTHERFSNVFRLIPLPDTVSWERPAAPKFNPFTGLQRNPDAKVTSTIYVSKMTTGFTREVGDFQKPKIRYLATDPVEVGHVIDGHIVQRTWEEANLTIVET